MAKTKLTLSVDKALIGRAKRFSRRNHTTVSELVTRFLSSLEEEDGVSTPITSRLVGVLGPEVSETEYHEYIEEKYR